MLKAECSTLKRIVKSLVEKELEAESLKKDVRDLQEEIENLKYFNQEPHYKIRLIEEELEDSVSDEEQSEHSDDDDKIENESKLNNNHLDLEADPLNKKLEFNSKINRNTEQQLEKCDDVTQKETTIIKHKTLDEAK